ncbi:hypothetical protein PIB30_040760 [Stylosanthes scabra]|uniref:Uncharacterized protein n=1 Tax=Stylosanthes scabra TaxID=79078 RepID=A0ABU6YF08_9FABA|nr:hypothetical protein [Stylosanthes scabra]
MADNNLQRARESACGDRWGRFSARLTRDEETKRLMAAVTNENVVREAKNERQRASERRNKWLAGELLTAREEASDDESGLVVLGTERRRQWSRVDLDDDDDDSRVEDTTIEPGSSFWEWFMILNRLTLLEGLVRQPTKYRFYRTWVTVKPVDSAKSCRPKANPATKMLLRPTVQRSDPVRL